jgi:hypothetical protein
MFCPSSPIGPNSLSFSSSDWTTPKCLYFNLSSNAISASGNGAIGVFFESSGMYMLEGAAGCNKELYLIVVVVIGVTMNRNGWMLVPSMGRCFLYQYDWYFLFILEI